MKIVVHPAVEAERWETLKRVVPDAVWVNAASETEAEAAMPGADALLGKITPAILARADRLRLGPGVHGEPGTLHVRGTGLRTRAC